MSRAIVITIIVAWPSVGILASYVMRRRGHDLFSWSVLGAFMGPLVIPLAVDHSRRTVSIREPLDVGGLAGQGLGPVNVLVAVDGSEASEAALCAAVNLLGDQIGRVTLVTVVDYEAADPQAAEASLEVREVAEDSLRQLAVTYSNWQPAALVLGGLPAAEVVEEATRGEYDLVVVGARGRSATKAVLGSTSARLVRDCKVPVLVLGPEAHSELAGTLRGATVKTA